LTARVEREGEDAGEDRGPAPTGGRATTDRRPRVTLLVNMVAPYRVPVYREIAKAFRLTLLYAGGEDNRASWDRCIAQVGAAEVRRSRGVMVKWRQRSAGGGVFETHYHPVTPGYFADLWRSRPDAIITNEMGLRTLIALVYGTLTRTPVWVWWGGTPHSERGIGAVRRVVRRVVTSWAHRWISYGEAATSYLASLGVPRCRVLQIQNCVDDRQFVAAARPERGPHEPPVVLAVGQLVGRKGFELLLDAAARLQHEGVRFSLRIVGNGPERPALEARVAKLRLGGVSIEPGVAPEAMPAIYRSADLLVFPTLQDIWGLVVNEALLSGLPVLASRYAGCATEVLPPAQVFDPLDADEFAATLRQALTAGLPAPDTSLLLSTREVAARIVADVGTRHRQAAGRTHAR
jgi:glycosyltransferase involved in cell wall biosynthesis